MKATQMAECLQKIAPRLDESDAAKLLKLAEVVGREGGKAFGPYCAKLEKALSADVTAPSSNAAASLLQWTGEIALVAGAGAQSKDFIAAARLVRLLGETSAAELSNSIEKALSPKPKKPPRPQRPAPIDPRSAADQLTALCHDSSQFEFLLTDLAKLPKAQFAKIAEYFLGFARGYKSKAEITTAIRARHVQDAIDGSREARGTKIAI